MKMEEELTRLMARHGVKVTANRLLIARTLTKAGRPMSLGELEAELDTIDKSNIFRSLQSFREAHLVHALEDMGQGVRYELCHAQGEDDDDDIHVHFYCTRCHKTFCLEDIPVPQVHVPEGYLPEIQSHLVRGICPACR